MIDAATLDSPRPPMGVQARLELPITRESVAAASGSFARLRPFAERPGDVEVPRAPSAGLNGQVAATMLRPIATPMVMGGFGSDAADLLAGAFRDYGFLPMAGDAGSPAADAMVDTTTPLKPGEPVGVNLVGGDFQMGATGTVTEVVGTRVCAFGHPFYNLGPIQFPMTRAYVHRCCPTSRRR